jgi:hypothetical protein
MYLYGLATLRKTSYQPFIFVINIHFSIVCVIIIDVKQKRLCGVTAKPLKKLLKGSNTVTPGYRNTAAANHFAGDVAVGWHRIFQFYFHFLLILKF